MDEEQSPVPAFQLQGTQGGSLNSKLKDVFGCLEALETKHQDFEKTRAVDDAQLDETLRRQGPSSEETEVVAPAFKAPTFPKGDYQQRKQGRDSGPDSRGGDMGQRGQPGRGQSYRGRNSRRGRTPDYKIHPEKWTEYSLEDVDTSDSANKQAAFAFLQERKAMKDAAMKEGEADVSGKACSKGLIAFKKPEKTKKSLALQQEDAAGPRGYTAGLDDSEPVEADVPGASSSKRKFENSKDSAVGDEPSETGGISVFKNRKHAKRNIRTKTADDSD